MTTKTIPAYLEDQRQKDRDALLRMEEEAARIQLHHGHHRTAKQPKLELPSAGAPAPKSENNRGGISEKAATSEKHDNEGSQGGMTHPRLHSQASTWQSLWAHVTADGKGRPDCPITSEQAVLDQGNPSIPA